MNVPFEFTSAPGAGTAAVGLIFDTTNNVTLAAIISAAVSGSTTAEKLAAVGLADVLTISDLYFTGLSVMANAAMKVEFGLYKATGTVFCPVFTVYGTEAVAGGVARDLGDGFLLPNESTQGTTHWNFAVRYTPDAAGTVRVAGDVRVRRRSMASGY